MTRALRRRHRAVAAALALVLPLGVAIALAARPDPALAPDASLRDAAGGPLTAVWQGATRDDALSIKARIGWSDPRSGHGPALELDVASALGQPELLAYWSPTRPVGDALPTGSVLLGPAAIQTTRRFALPGEARAHDGALVLFGLAQGRVASALALPAADRTSGDGQ